MCFELGKSFLRTELELISEDYYGNRPRAIDKI